MKNWTIGRRLAALSLTTLTVITILGAITWFKTGQMASNAGNIINKSLPELDVIGDIRFQSAVLRVSNMKHAMYAEAAKKDEIEKEVELEESQLAALFAQFGKLVQSGEQRALFDKINPIWEAYKAETKKLREASRAGKADETQALLLSAGKIGTELIKTVDGLDDLSTSAAQTSGRNVTSIVRSAKITVIAVVLISLVLCAALATLIGRSVSAVLRRAVTELLSGADHTTSASGQVSSSSQSLAAGASEQAASLEETSASLEEIASMTKRNADNAQTTKSLANLARTAADAGSSDMQQMSRAMQEIKDSSDDIAKIIKTIDEIAFQTNILALNAAVEAARAGEAGMGFAVVADEVRNLAQRSASAAKETAGKIETAISKTAQGVHMSEKVAKGLSDIVTNVRKVDELVAEIASASKEQSDGLGQINTAVAQMDKVTQSNAASAEEIAASSEELNSQTEVLRTAVSSLAKLVGQRVDAVEAPASPAPSTSGKNFFANGHQANPVLRSRPENSRQGKTSKPEHALAGNHDLLPMDGDFKDFSSVR